MSTLRLNKLSFFDSSDSSVAIDTGSILTGTSAQFKITGGTTGQALTTDGSGNLTFADMISDPTMGGDLSGPASAAQIVANAVGTTEIATDAVTANEIAADAVGSSEIAADAVGSSEIATGAVGATEIASTIDLSSKTVTLPAASVTAHIPPTPTVISVTYPGSATNLDPAGGETLIITGTNFISGTEVEIGLVAAPTVIVDSATQITITTPALVSATYTLVIIHPLGHRGYISVSYSDTPSWTTTAGSLGSMTELTAGSFTILATSDSTITYAQQSGTLPSGITLAPSTGIISGTGTSDLAADTLYNFTMRATDQESQYSDRSFGITVNAVPSITSLDYPGDDTALDPAGAQILIITGASFEVGVTTTIDSTSVAVTRDSATQLTIPNTPAKAASTYTNGLVATNPSGLSATIDVSYSNLPVWTTPAGAITIGGPFYQQEALSVTVVATGDAPLTYALIGGTLPTGITLDVNTGVISGTIGVHGVATTYNFTIDVTDAQNQTVNRAFSILIEVSFPITNSLLFSNEYNQHMSRPFGASNNPNKWTWSLWTKKGNSSGRRILVSANKIGSLTADYVRLSFESDDKIRFHDYVGSTTNTDLISTQTFADPSAWYHIVLQWNTTIGNTESDRVKIFVNNIQITSFSTENYPGDDSWSPMDHAEGIAHVGGQPDLNEWGEGYFSEVNYISGLIAEPTSFGRIDNDTSQWVPKKYSGAYGSLGFYLDFKDGTSNTSFVDSSGLTRNTVTVNGDTNTSDTQKKFGTTSAHFDNNGDYLLVPGTSDWNAYGTSFTVDFWIYPESFQDYDMLIGCNNANAYGWNIQFGSTQQLYFMVGESGSWDFNTAGAGGLTALNANQWYHVAMVKADTTWNLYLDGTLYSGPFTSNSHNSNTVDLRIGVDAPWGVNRWYNGYMDELRISKSARWGSNFTPPTSAYVDDADTVLLMHMDGADGGTTFTDDAIGKAITSTGHTDHTMAKKKIDNSSIYFGGGDYLSIPNSADLNYGSSDFTIECWIYNDIVQGTNSLYTTALSSGNTNGMQMEWQSANGNLAVWDYSLNNDWTILAGTGTTATPVDQWYHFAFVRNGDVFKMYIDGVAGSTTRTQSGTIEPTLGPSIGFHRTDSGRYIEDSYIDEFRISNTARYTSDFSGSLPTTAFTTDANTLLLIHSNVIGLGTDASTNSNNLATSNIVSRFQVEDTPTNNFAVLDFASTSPTFYPRVGNLQYQAQGWSRCESTHHAPKSGKWYAEYHHGPQYNGGNPVHTKIGVTTSMFLETSNNQLGWNAGWLYSTETGNTTNGGDGGGSSITALAFGDILSILLDEDNQQWRFWVNNVEMPGSPYALPTTDMTYGFGVACYDNQRGVWNFGQESSFDGNKTGSAMATDANGIGEFYYQPPTGALALCSANLPDPAIIKSAEHFNTALYTGTGATHNITTVGFQPDLTWIRNRSADSGGMWLDSVKGPDKFLQVTNDNGDADDTGGSNFVSWDSLGFTVANAGNLANATGENYASWNWKGGGTAPTQTYVVTVEGSQDYYIDSYTGFGAWTGQKPTIDLQEGGTYTFDESDSSNSSHLFGFSTTADGTFGGGTEYTTGVTHIGTPGQAGAKTTIAVASGAPQLYYYCVYHGSMGGTLNTNSTMGSSNFEGSNPSIVTANPAAGFSIVSYTGDSSSTQYMGHGLSKAPECFILKSRSTAGHSWRVYHKGLGHFHQSLFFSNNQASNNNSSVWGADPDVNYISVGNDAGVNTTGDKYTAWCFHSVPGYSMFGEYAGNDNSDGPFMHLGFKPALFISKVWNATGAWGHLDSDRPLYNPTNENFTPHSVSVPGTSSQCDFLSNGIKINTASGGQNTGTMVFMAFAESPFKYGNAR